MGGGMGPGTLRSCRSAEWHTRPPSKSQSEKGDAPPLHPWETVQSEEGNLSARSEGPRPALQAPPPPQRGKALGTAHDLRTRA